jgi:hypothetical protein
MTLLVGSSVLLALWTAYLAWRLPPLYHANHWDLAWVGFDVAQILMLIGTAWAAWRRRLIIILFAICAAMLFVTDAWFDIVTATGADFTRSVMSAVLVALPSAAVLFYVARRAVQNVSNEWWQALFQRDAPPPSRLTMPDFASPRTIPVD